jgi:hypothetical protein
VGTLGASGGAGLHQMMFVSWDLISDKLVMSKEFLICDGY